MKNLIIIALFFSSLLSAQSYYKKISDKNINTERQTIAKNFIQEFLNKCENKNFTSFEKFNIAKKFEMFLDEKISDICQKNETDLGKIELQNLNSAYFYKISLTSDPVELFIFNAKTEKNPEIKFLSVWVYQDRNYIRGIVITKEKPINPNKRE
ncbi:hypothetical protein [Cloacibacterium sp. TD35]|uniref:hypothetical protein n=1 Tax=Cloacibacterium sp. TD35 TaxID=2976818 RepID=UPI00237DEC41|nr:hypothetical protein [Cloacibacterium sp. TD35]WDT67145.1 hypothetical protein N7277_07330 [Cloacibacterium sp. TD35]